MQCQKPATRESESALSANYVNTSTNAGSCSIITQNADNKFTGADKYRLAANLSKLKPIVTSNIYRQTICETAAI